jgi:EAL domain-containing protein (putative c-di-GMP-specific phosphodiesterase class I)
VRSACQGCGDGTELGFDFTFAFQPIVDVSRGAVFAQEALVRGLDGSGAPAVLGRVNDDNRYRFDQACRVKAVALAKQLGIDRADQHLSINFLPNAVYQPDACIRTTLRAAEQTGFPLNRIIFEVTEGERVSDREHLKRIIQAYKRYGFLTAIDDFGAGHSGLNLLSDYQPDLLKIDINLVRGIEDSRPRRAIVRGILAVADDLGIRVIAEGIETAAERDVLADLGLRLMQGYLFARPSFEALAEIAAA